MEVLYLLKNDSPVPSLPPTPDKYHSILSILYEFDCFGYLM